VDRDHRPFDRDHSFRSILIIDFVGSRSPIPVILIIPDVTTALDRR